jgi:hypothetical protein
MVFPPCAGRTYPSVATKSEPRLAVLFCYWGRLDGAKNPALYSDTRGGCRSGYRVLCGGNAREAVRALIVANHFLESDLDKLQAAVSMGYARGKLFEVAKTLPRDRKDWYD